MATKTHHTVYVTEDCAAYVDCRKDGRLVNVADYAMGRTDRAHSTDLLDNPQADGQYTDAEIEKYYL